MVRRRQQQRNALRRCGRQATEQLDSTRGTYVRPDPADCTTRDWVAPYDDANTIRAQTLLWRHSGRLANFVINAQVLTSEGWETIEYVDCCHGHCHLHAEGKDEVQSIMPLDSIEDVQPAYAAASQLIQERLRIIRDTRGA